MTKPKIVWEKWVDPLNTNVDEVEYPGYNFPSYEDDRPIEFLSPDPDFEQKFEDQLESAEEQEQQRNITYNPIRIVSTPHGFVSLTEHSFASKSFDFWTMHYNKDITQDIAEKIEKCEGVETINVLTRYRARIGFNRTLLQSGAFSLNSIRKKIEETIIEEKKNDSYLETCKQLLMFTKDVKEVVDEIKKRFSQSSKFWAIYVLPNGKTETVSSTKETEEFQRQVELFKATKKMVGGEILESEKKTNDI